MGGSYLGAGRGGYRRRRGRGGGGGCLGKRGWGLSGEDGRGGGGGCLGGRGWGDCRERMGRGGRGRFSVLGAGRKRGRGCAATWSGSPRRRPPARRCRHRCPRQPGTPGPRPRPGPAPAPRAHLHASAAPPGAAKATCPCPPWAASARAAADPQVTRELGTRVGPWGGNPGAGPGGGVVGVGGKPGWGTSGLSGAPTGAIHVVGLGAAARPWPLPTSDLHGCPMSAAVLAPVLSLHVSRPAGQDSESLVAGVTARPRGEGVSAASGRGAP